MGAHGDYPDELDRPRQRVRRLVIGVPPLMGYWAGRLVGALTGDVTITREEIAGLMANLLYVETPPAGTTKLTDWIAAHTDTLGRRYTSELARRLDRAGHIGAIKDTPRLEDKSHIQALRVRSTITWHKGFSSG